MSAAIKAAMMSKSGTGAGDIEKVREKLKHYVENPAFTTWQFDRMELGDVGSATIAAELEKEVSVTSLHLSENGIGDIGATALGKALETNQSVQSLFLTENAIGNSGAVAIGTGLANNETLLSLSLSQNLIGDNGAQALSSAIGLSPEAQAEWEARTGRAAKQNSTLKKIYINDNELSDQGAAYMATCIEGHTRIGGLLEMCNVRRNKTMTAEGEALVESAMKAAAVVAGRRSKDNGKRKGDRKTEDRKSGADGARRSGGSRPDTGKSGDR